MFVVIGYYDISLDELGGDADNIFLLDLLRRFLRILAQTDARHKSDGKQRGDNLVHGLLLGWRSGAYSIAMGARTKGTTYGCTGALVRRQPESKRLPPAVCKRLSVPI